MLAELNCLNCGRHLADLIRGDDGRPRLDHPAGQAHRPIMVNVVRGGAQCSRCGGRALAERPISIDIRPAMAKPAA